MAHYSVKLMMSPYGPYKMYNSHWPHSLLLALRVAPSFSPIQKLLDSFSAKLPNHGNRDSHIYTFPLFQQSLEKAGIAARGNLPPLARPLIV
jgi:hypothetical protein